MRRNAAFAIAAAMMIGLSGCSWFGSGDKKEAAVEEAAAPAEPVETVRNIEFGRTRDGAAITAFGYAAGVGYGAPELRARREGKVGPDGFLDFDFFARPPHGGFGLGKGEMKARLVRADILLTPRQLAGVHGIRVHGVSGGLQVAF